MARGIAETAKKMKREVTSKAKSLVGKVDSKMSKNKSGSKSIKAGSKSTMGSRNDGRSWTKDDTRDLKRHVKDGAPARLISTKMGRPESSIRYYAKKAGISLKQKVSGLGTKSRKGSVAGSRTTV